LTFEDCFGKIINTKRISFYIRKSELIKENVMKIECKAVAPFYKNGYLISFDDTSDAVMIDPGDEVNELLEYVKKDTLNIIYILLTHGHIDHLFGVKKAKEETGGKICLHPDDIKLYNTVLEQAEWFGVEIEPLPKIDMFLMDNQIIKIGNNIIKVIHTPGHTPGGVCFLIENNLFCGDTLFEGSIGRTDLPGGDCNKLIESINNKLLILDDSTIVYPGHGPFTTIGREKEQNPFLYDAF
jgi:glyoxylase-like metal-dependent hydrolase (beta-lactamase superfamily II)